MACKNMVSTSDCDYLTQDDEVLGQRFACVSFLCPDADILESKEVHHFDCFIRDVFMNKIDSFVQAVTQSPENINSFTEALKSDVQSCSDDFTCFVANNRNKLETAFESNHPLQLTQAGFKVRGCYPTLESAKQRAEILQREEPNVSVFVMQVGTWCPFNPCAESIGEVVYDDTELNTIMKLKTEADARRSEVFSQTTKLRIEKDISEGRGSKDHQQSSNGDDE